MDLIDYILVPIFCIKLIKKNKDMADIPSIHQTQIVLMHLIKWFPLELNTFLPNMKMKMKKKTYVILANNF